MNDPIHEIVGEVYIKAGLLKKDIYRIYFLEDSAIFIHITKDRLKEEQKQLRDTMKGQKLKDKLGTMLHSKQTIYEQYKEMSKDELLKLGENSFELKYQDVQKVKRHARMDEEGISEPSRVTIKTYTGKIKLQFQDHQASAKTYKYLKKLTK